MNYQKHYNRLIERARNRKLEGYKERHHIVPRCLGGDDSKENLVDLTPEEHYVAHQLLVKIHPNNGRLVHAAVMMVADRPSNKLYGWLRRKVSNEAKKRTGEKNGSYGTRWVNDGVKSFKIRKDEPLQEGLKEGRVCESDVKFLICKFCKTPFKQKNGNSKQQSCSRRCSNMLRNSLNGREGEFFENYILMGSMNKALKVMKKGGAVGSYYEWAKYVIERYTQVSALASTQKKP